MIFAGADFRSQFSGCWLRSIVNYMEEEAISYSRKAAYNTVIQVVGRVAGLLINLITINYLANYLIVNDSAVEGFGQYTTVFAFISVIGALADMGLFTLLVRETSGKLKSDAGRMVSTVLVFRLLLFFGTLVFFALISRLLPYDLAVKRGIIIGIAVAYLMLMSQTVAAVFQVHFQANKIVISEVLGKVTIAALTVLALHQGYGLLAVVFVNLIGNIVTFVISLWLGRSLVKIDWRPDWRLGKLLLPEFGSIALISVLSLVHFRTDTVLLSLLKPGVDVGIYGLAYKLYDIAIIVPSILATNLLPILTRLHDFSSPQKVSKVTLAGISVFLAISFVSLFVVFFLAGPLIMFVAQTDFLPAELPLKVLALTLPAAFLVSLFSQVLISMRSQKELLKGYAWAVVINLVLNLITIPLYSYKAAAATTLFTEVLLALYTAYIVGKRVNIWRGIASYSRIVCSSAVLFALFFYLYGKIFPQIHQFSSIGKLGQSFYLMAYILVIVSFSALLFWASYGFSFRKIIKEIRI